MGAEALALIGLVAGVWKGISGRKAYNEQANQYDEAGVLLEKEAYRDAAVIEDEGKRFAAEQKQQYLGSGVQIGGSAVVTLAQTDKWTATKAENTRSRGRALRAYNERSGSLARGQGRAAFIGGIAEGVTSAVGIYGKAKAGFGGGKGLKEGTYDPRSPDNWGHNPPR